MSRGKKLLSLLLVLTLTLSLFTFTSVSASAITTPGSVMLLGGGMSDDNAEVYNALNAAAGGGTP